ncbi:MAG: outer membrane protein assembly factor BamE [Dechloromonas sp.]|nr:MAG: outer membrane protein assembly factor BamE [Dechloromonas sp.]
MVAQLKPGQTREQVRFILGTPLLTDVFHQDRWDYAYSYRNGRTGEVTRYFSVFFDQSNRLVKSPATSKWRVLKTSARRRRTRG